MSMNNPPGRTCGYPYCGGNSPECETCSFNTKAAEPPTEPPRAAFLDLAERCGATMTGKPDATEPITVVFSVEAWRKFDAAFAPVDMVKLVEAWKRGFVDTPVEPIMPTIHTVKPVAFFFRFHTDDSLEGKPNVRSWQLCEGEPHPSLYESGEVRLLVDETPPIKKATAAPVEDAWIGCGDCDCIFGCYNGKSACIRLPK